MTLILSSLHTINPNAVVISCLSVVIVMFWPKSYAAHNSLMGRLIARMPGTLVALVMGTLIASGMELQVATIGSAFGQIPQGLPSLTLPEFDWQRSAICLRRYSPSLFLGRSSRFCVHGLPIQ